MIRPVHGGWHRYLSATCRAASSSQRTICTSVDRATSCVATREDTIGEAGRAAGTNRSRRNQQSPRTCVLAPCTALVSIWRYMYIVHAAATSGRRCRFGARMLGVTLTLGSSGVYETPLGSAHAGPTAAVSPGSSSVAEQCQEAMHARAAHTCSAIHCNALLRHNPACSLALMVQRARPQSAHKVRRPHYDVTSCAVIACCDMFESKP